MKIDVTIKLMALDSDTDLFALQHNVYEVIECRGWSSVFDREDQIYK
jgi:hypothetical protein